MDASNKLQSAELLNYTKASSEKLVGLADELIEDVNGGVQVQALMDSNVASGVNVVALKEGAVANNQQGRQATPKSVISH